MKTIFLYFYHIPRNILCFLIRGYQKSLSPDHGYISRFFPYGYCKFSPSCSQYAHDTIKKRGVIVGIFLSSYRILRCNPWSKGGHDPVK